MATQSDRQQAYKLIGVFDKLWKKKYGKPYKGNRHADRWGFEDMIYDLGYEGALSVIEYYFKLQKRGHPRQWLLYNYADLNQQMEEIAAQREFRRRVMEETRRRDEG